MMDLIVSNDGVKNTRQMDYNNFKRKIDILHDKSSMYIYILKMKHVL